MKYFWCPYCGMELINQNEFIDCDNKNEFWSNIREITFIVYEDGEVIEE